MFVPFVCDKNIRTIILLKYIVILLCRVINNDIIIQNLDFNMLNFCKVDIDSIFILHC